MRGVSSNGHVLLFLRHFVMENIGHRLTLVIVILMKYLLVLHILLLLLIK